MNKKISSAPNFSKYFFKARDNEKEEEREQEDEERVESDVSMLNEEQLRALQMAESGETFMLDGASGVGKTLTIGKITHRLSRRYGQSRVAVTATTAAAATLLPDGVTLHSWLGLQKMEGSTAKLVKQLMTGHKAALKKHGEKASASVLIGCDPYTRLRETCVLVVDEVSMLSCALLRKLDNVLRRVREQLTTPFGGLQVIFSGDFYQLPPVVNVKQKRKQQSSWRESHQAQADAAGMAFSEQQQGGGGGDESTEYTEVSADEDDRNTELKRHRNELYEAGELALPSEAHLRLAIEWKGARDIKSVGHARFKRKRRRVQIASSLKKFAFESERWREAIGPRVVRLHRTYRQSDPVFISLLTRARQGALNANDLTLLRTRIEAPMQPLAVAADAAPSDVRLSPSSISNSKRILADIDLLEIGALVSERSRLVPELHAKRQEVAEINARQMKRLAEQGAPEQCFRAKVGIAERPPYISEHSARQLLMGEAGDERVVLRVGAIVQLTVNFDQSKRLVNGSTGVVVGFVDDPARARLDFALNDRWGPMRNAYPSEHSREQFVRALQQARRACFEGSQIRIPLVYFGEHSRRIDDQQEEVAYVLPVTPYVYERRVPYAFVSGWVAQIPLRPCWAITMHGSQGVSLDRARIDLRRSRWDPVAGSGSPGIFSPGQAYVALSRLRTLQGLQLIGLDPEAIYASEQVKKWYTEVNAIERHRKLASTPVVAAAVAAEDVLDVAKFKQLTEDEELMSNRPSVLLKTFICHFEKKSNAGC